MTSSSPVVSARTRASSNSLVLAIVGSGGDGVVLLGNLLLSTAARQGLYGVMVQSYGPQIRGGESAVVLRLSDTEVQYEGDEVDLLLCFRLSDITRFQGSVRLRPGGLVLLDEAETGAIPAWLSHDGTPPLRYPFARLENGVEVAGEPKNMLGFGHLCRMLGWPAEIARQALTEKFSRKRAALDQNLASFEKAWNTPGWPALPKVTGHARELVVETGNEAVARGSMAAGLRFFAGYPITPSSEIMETLIRELPALGGKVVQAEDEIAAIGMVIGASFGGVPSMTATSGPGLSLMTEMTGLSSMAEVPAVVVDCQRAGPATGMPSRTEQSDLFHAVFGGHGDFPRAVLGVFDVVHAHEAMGKAFLLSETYQLPVFVLSDAYVAQRRQVHGPIAAGPAPPQRLLWKAGDGPARFHVSGDSVVAPFRVPGTVEGGYLAAGIEHTEEGSPTADTAQHQRMNAQRFKKLDAIADLTRDWFRTFGPPEAKRGIVAWGSQFGLLREWAGRHPEYRVFLPEILHPFPLAGFEAWRRGIESLAIVELSFQGQFHRYLSSLTDMRGATPVTRSGGVPLSGSELDRLLKEAHA